MISDLCGTIYEKGAHFVVGVNEVISTDSCNVFLLRYIDYLELHSSVGEAYDLAKDKIDYRYYLN